MVLINSGGAAGSGSGSSPASPTAPDDPAGRPAGQADRPDQGRRRHHRPEVGPGLTGLGPKPPMPTRKEPAMPPAARVGDMHMCPMVTPGVPPIPHVGGPILPPGGITVMIGGQPAARMGDMAVCVGPPDTHRDGLADRHDRQHDGRPDGRPHGPRRDDRHRLPHRDDRHPRPGARRSRPRPRPAPRSASPEGTDLRASVEALHPPGSSEPCA